jgi:thiamine pyrophosphate-dependent acetolactate synthase large subunit-like protein
MLLLTDLSDQAPFSQHSPYPGGTGEYGTFDTRKSLEGATKYTTVVQEPVQAVQGTQLAIKHALSGEPGPVAVVYHAAAFRGRVGPESRPRLYSTRAYLPRKSHGDAADVEAAAGLLLEAERPVILAGNGVRISAAYDELRALAELLGAPVATTAAGKGVFAETGEWALGVCGTFGQATANAVIGQADAVLVVGSRLGPVDTANESPALIDPGRQTLVQVDTEPKNASWSFPCDRVVCGRCRARAGAARGRDSRPGRPHGGDARHAPMNGLMTARDEDIPIVVVVLNNSALGWVKHGQGDRVIASEFADMNSAEIARAMGCGGIRVEEPDKLPGALAEALGAKVATVIDVVTSQKPTFRDVTSPLLTRDKAWFEYAMPDGWVARSSTSCPLAT